MHGTERPATEQPTSRSRAADARRGRGLAAPASSATARSCEAQLGDLRGAALLRAAGRRPDAGRGHRHRRAHLRHLPGRLPDERGPRLRGRSPASQIDPAGPRAPPAPLLRRVDREPRPPRLPAPRARLPRLPERDRAGARPPRASSSGASRSSETGNRIVALLGGRPIHPVSVRVGGFSRVPTRAELARAPAGARRRRSAIAQETVDFVADLRRARLRARAAPRLAAPPDRVPDERGPDRLDRRPRHRRRRLASARSRRTRSPWSNALQARTHAGEVVPARARRRGSPSTRDRLHPLARAALDRIGLADEIRAQPVLEHRGPGRRAGPRHGRGDRHRRRLPAAGPRRAQPWTPRAGTAGWATEAPRGLLFHRYELDERGLDRQRADRAADEPEPGRHRGRPDRVRAVGPRPAARRGHPSGSSSSSAATTRASRARRTSST